jgi:hypothetical protein
MVSDNVVKIVGSSDDDLRNHQSASVLKAFFLLLDPYAADRLICQQDNIRFHDQTLKTPIQGPKF